MVYFFQAPQRGMKPGHRLQLGHKIRAFRQKAGYTQERLAELAGLDYKYLQRIEGKNTPNLKIDTIEKLAKALRIKPAKLLES